MDLVRKILERNRLPCLKMTLLLSSSHVLSRTIGVLTPCCVDGDDDVYK